MNMNINMKMSIDIDTDMIFKGTIDKSDKILNYISKAKKIKSVLAVEPCMIFTFFLSYFLESHQFFKYLWK